MEVVDEELGTSPTASPEPVRSPSQRPMSLPPKLPPQGHHDGTADTSLLGAPTEAPAGLMKVSEFSALTAKPVPRKPRFALATIAALVGGLLLGFVVLGRLSGKREKIVPVQAAAGAVVIVAQEPVPSAMPSASAAASASATPSAPAPAAESAEPAPAPAPVASETKPAETPPSTGTPSTGTSSGSTSAGSHRPTTTHGPVNSGYKPGGI
jgi:hypothetical protein